MTLTIPDELRTQIIEHCVSAAPNEGCGLIAVDDGWVTRVYPTSNAQASPTGYTVPPEEHFAAMSDAESRGWAIGGVFHSHPNGEARPSMVDVVSALEPEWIYLVVGLKESPEMRAWRIEGGEMSEVDIAPIGNTGPMHRTIEELQGFLDEIAQAPSDAGRVEMIVRRPAEDERESVDSGKLDPELGLVGDNWVDRGEPSPETQLTLMSSRVLNAVAGNRERWPLAGDQIVVDMDLSRENLPVGTKLRIGDAVVEITATPHTGCAKFAERFGNDGLRFVNIGEGRERRFRGAYARIVESGVFSVGDQVTKT